MSPTSFTLTISKWLSHVESSDTPISSPSNSPCNSRKRQRSPSPDPQPAELDTDHQRKRLQLRRSVLREIPGNIMLSPQASPEKRGGNASNVSIELVYVFGIPKTDSLPATYHTSREEEKGRQLRSRFDRKPPQRPPQPSGARHAFRGRANLRSLH